MRLRERFMQLARANCQVRSYDGVTHPFCWNAKMLRPVTFEQVFAKLVENDYHNEADAIVTLGVDKATIKKAFDEVSYDWEQGVLEEMREDFTDEQQATMRSCTPQRYKKWGIRNAADTWEVQYRFRGRDGGWLVMTDFEGFALTHMNTSPDYKVFEHERDSAWLRKLCCMIDEVSWMVDHRYEEYAYKMAWHLHEELNRD